MLYHVGFTLNEHKCCYSISLFPYPKGTDIDFFSDIIFTQFPSKKYPFSRDEIEEKKIDQNIDRIDFVKIYFREKNWIRFNVRSHRIVFEMIICALCSIKVCTRSSLNLVSCYLCHFHHIKNRNFEKELPTDWIEMQMRVLIHIKLVHIAIYIYYIGPPRQHWYILNVSNCEIKWNYKHFTFHI